MNYTEIFTNAEPTITKMPDGEWLIDFPSTDFRVQLSDSSLPPQ